MVLKSLWLDSEVLSLFLQVPLIFPKQLLLIYSFQLLLQGTHKIKIPKQAYYF